MKTSVSPSVSKQTVQQYIATFHTHLSALLTSRALQNAGCTARMAPVPRSLSSSCGTCVRYEGASPMLEVMDEDVERVYELGAGEAYTLLKENL